MAYTEFLRVRNLLKWTSIVLGAFVVLVLALRIGGVQGSGPQDVPLSAFIVSGAAISLIVATILGAPFARENTHLEIAFTKPVDRVNLSVETMLTDVAGIVAAFVLGALFLFILKMIFPGNDVAPMTRQDLVYLGDGLLSPLAWYALLSAATSWMKGAYGVVLGLAWPISGAVLGLAKMSGDDSLRTAIRSFFGALAYLDPFYYSAGARAPAFDLSMLAVLTLVYGTVAVAMWRRVEA